MTCKRSKQCDNADLCRFAQSDDYNLLGGSCFTPKDPQTNEEWLKHCNTEQLADVLFRICERATWDYNVKIMVGEKRKELIVEWLKQPHTTE